MKGERKKERKSCYDLSFTFFFFFRDKDKKDKLSRERREESDEGTLSFLNSKNKLIL